MKRPRRERRKRAPEGYGFTEARYRCIKYLPYAYSHVASLVPVERPGLGTVSVDKHMRVYYDPAMFAQRPIDECTAAILHEDLHVLLRHFERAADYLGHDPAPEDWHRWNVACDLTVNQTLRKAKVPITEGWLLPEQYGFEENLSVEQYYDLLNKQDDEETPQGQGDDQEQDDQDEDSGGDDSQGGTGDNGDTQQQPSGGPSGEPYDGDEQPQPGQGSGGSCADGQPREWECPPPENCDTLGLDEYNQKMIERHVAQEIEQREKDKGDVPGYLTRFAQQKLRPKVDPFKALHAAVKYAVTTTSGRGDYTWRKLPRRSPPGGLRLPSPIKPVPRATVIVDTSGSMGQKDLAKALGVVEQGLRSVPAGGIRVLAGDTCVQSAQKVFRAEQVELAGGGGTDMGKLIVQAAEERPAPDAIVVVTDGWTPWPKQKVKPHVVACLTEDGAPQCCKVPDWIVKVVLE